MYYMLSLMTPNILRPSLRPSTSRGLFLIPRHTTVIDEIFLALNYIKSLI